MVGQVQVSVVDGAIIARDKPVAERADYGQVVLGFRLRDALVELDPDFPAEALGGTFCKLPRLEVWRIEGRKPRLHLCSSVVGSVELLPESTASLP